jgi:hypothetical protein
LQRTENRLIRHQLAEPDVQSAEELRQLGRSLKFRSEVGISRCHSVA